MTIAILVWVQHLYLLSRDIKFGHIHIYIYDVHPALDIGNSSAFEFVCVQMLFYPSVRKRNRKESRQAKVNVCKLQTIERSSIYYKILQMFVPSNSKAHTHIIPICSPIPRNTFGKERKAFIIYVCISIATEHSTYVHRTHTPYPYKIDPKST